MAQSISNVLVLFFRFQLDVVLVSFRVEVFGDWSVESLLFPLFNVLEVMFLVEGGVRYEPVFVSKDDFLVVNVLPFESQIIKFRLYWTILIDVCVNTSDSVFVWSVKVADSLPYFSLDSEIVFKVVDDLVIFTDLDLVVVLVELGVNIFRRVRILVGEPWIFFILDFGVCLEFVEIVDFLLGSKEGESLVGTEPVQSLINSVLEHLFPFVNL